jgi:hypothetical protein
MNTPPTLMNDTAAAEPAGNTPRERVLMLGFLYLQAGLRPEDAYRSALADYECGFAEGTV